MPEMREPDDAAPDRHPILGLFHFSRLPGENRSDRLRSGRSVTALASLGMKLSPQQANFLRHLTTVAGEGGVLPPDEWGTSADIRIKASFVRHGIVTADAPGVGPFRLIREHAAVRAQLAESNPQPKAVP